ncbi:Ig-like domain-containing protein [Paraburkholderia bannensis]|uniref:Ig-like domain-containing protein n=1 Tax=Paraburkholderia bannensis TaxID=765414 RepID=UPI002AC36962|nr:hypothetical protein [Paraburkholderia bannensis]
MKKAISAQKTRMYLEDLTAPAAATGLLVSLSKSKPAVAVFDDVAALRSGAAVYFIGTGFASIDGQSWVLQNIDINTKSVELANSDTSNETGDFSAAGAAWILRAYADMCVVSYQINENTAAEIDTTTLCDDEKTSLAGFSDPGTLTFEFFIDPTDPDYHALLEADKDKETRWFEIVYRNKAVRTLPVIVQSISESGGVDQAVQGSATLKVAGAPVLTQPPGEVTPNYTLIATASPSIGDVPLEVLLTLNEAGGTATKFVVDWKDGSATTETTSKQITHTYEEAGQYQPTIIATIEGEDTAPFKTQNIITAQRLPYSLTANVTPASGDAPLEVSLTYIETNGPADYIDVDWGDGTPADRVTVSPAAHEYEKGGSFTPALTPTIDGVAGTPVSAPTVIVTDAITGISASVVADNVIADGTEQNAVTFKALTQSGAEASSAPITITSSSETAVVAPVRGDAGGDGVPVMVTNTVAETVTLTATLDADDEIKVTQDVTFGEATADSTPASISISVDTDNAPADGVTPDKITVIAKNAAGDPVNAAVSLIATGSAALGIASGKTGTDGLVSNVTDETAETVTITATLDSDDTIKGTADLTFAEVQE